jgi:hypothetical protein
VIGAALRTTCTNALAGSCEFAKRASAGNCLVCAGQHQETLQGAGCQEADFDSWCSGQLPSPSVVLVVWEHINIQWLSEDLGVAAGQIPKWEDSDYDTICTYNSS